MEKEPRWTIVGTDLQQFEIVQVQRALGAGGLHHIQVVKALLAVSYGHKDTHTKRSEECISTKDQL